MDTNQFGGSFWITFCGLVLSFLGGLCVYCLKSKCKSCTLCCGFIKIERDVQAENDQERLEIENGISQSFPQQSK